MQPAIFISIIEIRPYPVTNDKVILFIYRHVARVKDAVNIPAEQYSVGNLVAATHGVRANMSRI